MYQKMASTLKPLRYFDTKMTKDNNNSQKEQKTKQNKQVNKQKEAGKKTNKQSKSEIFLSAITRPF